MTQPVAERANVTDNIANAARLISRSRQRYAVFEAIYYGRSEWKTATAIAKRAKLPRKRVVEEAKKIVDNGFASQKRVDGDMAYSRDRILYHHKAKVFAAAKNKAKLEAIPTRVNPKGVGATTVHIRLAGPNLKPRRITIDEIASFSRVRTVAKADTKLRLSAMAESQVKTAFKAILGETHDFKDWGGEKNDLFTDKLRVSSARKNAAIAFKGRGTSGTLTPKKMGKNGDQIGRLFSSEAEVFLIVYHGKVDESVRNQMYAHAVAKSLGGKSVIYCVIDGDDLNRIAQAYRKEFGLRKS
jgi:hypothetical protein